MKMRFLSVGLAVFAAGACGDSTRSASAIYNMRPRLRTMSR